MALKIWTNFKNGDRVMACDNERNIGTITETGPDATVAGRVLVRWDDGTEPSWLRADLLSPSPHVEDDTWEYMFDLLLDGEVTPNDFRHQMTSAGYSVVQINSAIDYNWKDIRAMMVSESA